VAFDEAKIADGTKHVTVASAKLVGKKNFNAGIIMGKLGVKALQELPNIAARVVEQQLEERLNLPEERRGRIERFAQMCKIHFSLQIDKGG
jgi:hypothetical protein